MSSMVFWSWKVRDSQIIPIRLYKIMFPSFHPLLCLRLKRIKFNWLQRQFVPFFRYYFVVFFQRWGIAFDQANSSLTLFSVWFLSSLYFFYVYIELTHLLPIVFLNISHQRTYLIIFFSFILIAVVFYEWNEGVLRWVI